VPLIQPCLRVEFLLKTDSGYPKDTGVNKPWQPLGIPFAITPIGQLHQSPPSPIPGDLGRGPSHQSQVLEHRDTYVCLFAVSLLRFFFLGFFLRLTAKYARARLTNVKCSFVTYVTQDGIWTASSHPSPPPQLGFGNVPYVPPSSFYPRQPHDTADSLLPFSTLTLIRSKHCLALRKKTLKKSPRYNLYKDSTSP